MTLVDTPAPQPSFSQSVSLLLRTTSRHFRMCVALALPYALLGGLANGALRSVTLVVDPSTVTASEVAVAGILAIVITLAFLIVGLFIYPVTLGALTLVGSAEVYGDETNTKGVIKQVLDRGLEAVGAFLLVFLILLIAPVAAGLFGIGAGLAAGREVAFAGLIFVLFVLFVPAIYVAVRLSLAVPVVVREGRRAVESLRRSWDLVHGRWWWLFGFFIVVALVDAIVSALVRAVIGAVFSSNGWGGFLGAAFGGVLFTGISAILFGVATGVAYAALAPEGAWAVAREEANGVTGEEPSGELQAGAHEVFPQELPPLEEPPPPPSL